MASPKESTMMVCLFHHRDQAELALRDMEQIGISQQDIRVFDDAESTSTAGGNGFGELSIPARDRDNLTQGLKDGGVVVAVTAYGENAFKVESIFGDHRATKIDEAEAEPARAMPIASEAVTAGGATIPIVEEALVVGKRDVELSGVRVFRRVIEIPVEESVNLREENVHVERRAVDRTATELDLSLQGDRTIELTETAEEAVIGKSARVVEEVIVGKQATQRIEHIHETVRRTEVDVEEVAPEIADTKLST